MNFQANIETSAVLAFDLMSNGFHQPIVNGKANRDNIEDAITVGIMAGDLKYYITQDTVNLAIALIDDMIKLYGPKNGTSVAEGA